MTRDNKYITSINQIDSHRTRRKFPKSAFPPENPDELNLERWYKNYKYTNKNNIYLKIY